MSTFTFGLVISQLSEVNRTYHTALEKPKLKIYGRKDFHKEISVKIAIAIIPDSNGFNWLFFSISISITMQNVYEKVVVTLNSLRHYWDVDFPLKKLDIVALPSFSSVKPVDNWGLIVFK